MFKIKFILTALLIMFATNLTANAATIGYADFQKVLTEYKYARNAYKDIDNKLMELQQYVIDKEKQFKTIEYTRYRSTRKNVNFKIFKNLKFTIAIYKKICIMVSSELFRRSLK